MIWTDDPPWYYRPIRRTPPLNVRGFRSVELRDGWLYVGQRVDLDLGPEGPPLELRLRAVFDSSGFERAHRALGALRLESLMTPAWLPAAVLLGMGAALWIVYRMILFCDAASRGWRP